MNTVIARNLSELQQHAETIRDNAPHDLRTAIQPGDAWAQGDLLIRRLADLPEALIPITAERQLVEGTTKGARHCLSTLEGITMYRLAEPTVLEGPLFTAASDFTIEHPDHGDLLLPPGHYAIEYQQDITQRRVLD